MRTTVVERLLGAALQPFEDHPLKMMRDGRHLIGADGVLFCRMAPAPRGP